MLGKCCHCNHYRWYGPDLANFDASCRKLMNTFNTVLPEGSLQARIRCSSREYKNVKESSLGESLGNESTGMVQLVRNESVML